MKHHYISLGAACDVSMITKALRMRDVSQPFDWLWNLDGGLATVTEIIGSDFRGVMARDSYTRAEHYRVPGESVVYKAYPSIIHMHTNPLDTDEHHHELARRFERFRAILSTDDTIHFVYYRNFNEDQRRSPALAIRDTLGKLLGEGDTFLRAISSKRRGDTSLLLVLQTDIEHATAAEALLREAVMRDPRVRLGFTITRVDDSPAHMERWYRQWFSLLLNKTQMPLPMKLSILVARGRAEIQRGIRATRASAASLFRR